MLVSRIQRRTAVELAISNKEDDAKGSVAKKFQELVDFKQDHGHCSVPNHWHQNMALVHWVKRQRYQYKLRKDGKPSGMIQERQTVLDPLGFIWDSHSAVWDKYFDELDNFRELHRHCNVPTIFPENPRLAVWMKCQRRKFKIFFSSRFHNNGKKSDMNTILRVDRIAKLTMLGFVWDLRGKLTPRPY